jgi:hypothetical protein
MEDAKNGIPVKFMEAEGNCAEPKKARKLAYSPNWTFMLGVLWPVMVALRDWTTWWRMGS